MFQSNAEPNVGGFYNNAMEINWREFQGIVFKRNNELMLLRFLLADEVSNFQINDS